MFSGGRGSPRVFFQAQISTYWKSWKNTAPPGVDNGGIVDVSVPFNQLTPQQQEAVGHIKEADEKEGLKVDIDNKVTVQGEALSGVHAPAKSTVPSSPFKASVPYCRTRRLLPRHQILLLPQARLSRLAPRNPPSPPQSQKSFLASSTVPLPLPSMESLTSTRI